MKENEVLTDGCICVGLTFKSLTLFRQFVDRILTETIDGSYSLILNPICVILLTDISVENVLQILNYTKYSI